MYTVVSLTKNACLSGGNCSYIVRLSVRDLHGPTGGKIMFSEVSVILFGKGNTPALPHLGREIGCRPPLPTALPPCPPPSHVFAPPLPRKGHTGRIRQKGDPTQLPNNHVERTRGTNSQEGCPAKGAINTGKTLRFKGSI